MRDRSWFVPLLRTALIAVMPGCSTAESNPTADVRWVPPSQAGPHGSAPGARSRVLAEQSDGVKHYVLVLEDGDEVATALADFAHEQRVVNAHFVAIGAVREPEVAWFDKSRHSYKTIARHQQMEVLTLSGDIALTENGQPVAHTHLVLGGDDGSAWGGHLLSAIASPTLEVYLTTFPTPLHKRVDPNTELQLIDPSISENGSP